MPPSFKLATLTLAVNAALITPVAAQAADEDLPLVTLPTITVTAETETETADGPVDGIAASTVSSTTGFDESILKSTQSVTVVGQQEIQSIGADDVIGALEYSTGVNRTEAADRTTVKYMVRGFLNYTEYRDGQQYQVNTYNGEQEIYGLERIEVLKGANSILNGTLPPGGVINGISKKPFFDNAYEINAEVGSFDRKQVSADINHKVNDDVAVRLVGVFRDSDTFVDFVPDDRTYIAPSLTWQLGDSTSLTVSADYQQDMTATVYGLPDEGTVAPTKNGKIDRSFNQGVKGFDGYDNERYTLGYSIEHNVTPQLKLNHKLRHMAAKTDIKYTTYDELLAGSETEYSRYPLRLKHDSDSIVASLSAEYDWKLGNHITNLTLAGVDYTDQTFDFEGYKAITVSSLDFYNPDHSKDTIGDLVPYDGFTGRDDSKQTGIYLQNQATIDDTWVALIGVRHDIATGTQRSIFLKDGQAKTDTNATTGRIGLVYLMDNGIAPFTSINQSFLPNYGIDRNGDFFEPTKGTQYEVGVRYQPVGSDTLLTGSLYQINQTDVLVKDPKDKNFKTQLGEVRSQGLELEAKTQLSDNANLIAAYSYTDARTIESSPLTPELEGKRTGNVPYNTFSLWGDYRFDGLGIPQLKFGVGVRFKDRAVGTSNRVEFPSYTLVDAMASYEVNDNWLLSLNAKNLLDEEYVTCTYNCFYGEPRNIVGKVTYKW
ncbi:TonB-dependent siderophore receptor [Psychrobacter pygoscelis]|uniref:TonB-dependent siderophore receptor n=1 Tax=Psychrobacter pygoscelis TaxID=2488563 RepID=UPI00103E762C|nr:TonB-dependent siderophore receptor [Psychrobacter pygoscelis]